MTKKRSGTVTINSEWCKGCGICVHFCPTKTLAMREFKAAVEYPEKCNGCMMCELRCPDFAVEAKTTETEKAE
ncbi:MAG: 4Fe-4S binding protein [Deferribacteraceae bacterium]|jgi:2-oxoglutarate ferredoxin oxidoreductase subunit delta|nr:4Fe-4S binding protein [Deferribacteraceae bacterium]